MADVSKVVKGLECHLDGHMCDGYCPYGDESKRIEECSEELARDALAILQEEYPEIVTCKNCIHAHDVSDMFPDMPYMCKNFGYLLFGVWVPSFHDGDWFCAGGERRLEGG